MKRIHFLSLSLLLLASCQTTKDQSEECVEKPVSDGYVCAQLYQPVCGCNDKTYSNACEADARGIAVVSQGECPEK